MLPTFAPNSRPGIHSMHRIVTSTLLMMAAFPALAAAQIGIMGGYNVDTFDGFSDDRFELVDDTSGFNTGIFLDFEFGRIGLRPAIVYHRLTDAVIEDPESGPADIEIIEIPLHVRLSAPLPVATPYVLVGPTLMFPSSARPLVGDALAGTRVRWGIGLGVEWDLGFRLWPEIRYGRSIGGLVEGDTAKASQLSTFMVTIGVSF
jgi:hypothetical protein